MAITPPADAAIGIEKEAAKEKIQVALQAVSLESANFKEVTGIASSTGGEASTGRVSEGQGRKGTGTQGPMADSATGMVLDGTTTATIGEASPAEHAAKV